MFSLQNLRPGKDNIAHNKYLGLIRRWAWMPWHKHQAIYTTRNRKHGLVSTGYL